MNRTFDEVIKGIRKAENDVDKVLDAAKLSRNPIERRRELEIISGSIISIVGIIAGSSVFMMCMMLMVHGR